MTTRFRGRIAAAAGAAALILILGAPASAQQAMIIVQTAPPAYLNIQRVPYGDLNLLTFAGEQSLHRRVSRAVENVCLYDNDRWYGLSEPDYNHCSWSAWQRAQPQMAAAIYRARQMAYYYRGY
jgi:UrcA family protein